MIRIVIADDHALMRAGMRQLFALTPDVEVVGEAADANELLPLLDRGGVDVLLLDLSMPGAHGVELIGRLRARYAGLPVLMVSMHDKAPIAREALKAGARGYLGKDAEPETLVAAVRRVAAGGFFIDPAIAEAMALESAGQAATLAHDALSERERQLLPLLARGLSIGAIADMLGLSAKTVSSHKARMMDKMGFRSAAELVRYALEHDLIA